ERHVSRILLAGLALAALSACAGEPPRLEASSATADSYANFLVGRVANLRDDHQAASDRLYRAVLATPGDPALVEDALAAALATGDAERVHAIAHLRVRDAAPPYAQIVRGVEAINANRWREARTNLESARGDAPEQLIARLLLVWAKVGEGRVGD